AFKVLGTGCAKCTKTAALIQAIATELDQQIQVSKETSPQEIMNYQVMSTPAVVLNEELVHSGSIPTRNQVTEWLTS
ncbi:glutaredoxin, partial [Oleiphilus sp. HI0081]